MAKTSKKETALSLETVLWNCRVALRGIGSTEKNRDAVIGLVFLKFVGDKFEKRRAELLSQYGDIPAFLEKASFYNAVNVFYLKEKARWSYLSANSSENNIAVLLDQAMEDIEKDNPPLTGALPKNLFVTLGAEKSKLKSLIDNVNQIDENRFQEEDLIGRVYEYFLQVYAASGTKEDGEFYTPACAVKLIAEMIEPYSGVVYDKRITYLIQTYEKMQSSKPLIHGLSGICFFRKMPYKAKMHSTLPFFRVDFGRGVCIEILLSFVGGAFCQRENASSSFSGLLAFKNLYRL